MILVIKESTGRYALAVQKFKKRNVFLGRRPLDKIAAEIRILHTAMSLVVF